MGVGGTLGPALRTSPMIFHPGCVFSPAESSAIMKSADSRTLNHARRRCAHSAMLALHCYSRENKLLFLLSHFNLGVVYYHSTLP